MKKGKIRDVRRGRCKKQSWEAELKREGERGFTIIEVALVLAIAGGIFLMVFLALPALRSSQRNEERREDVAKLISAVKDYQSNNRGALPGGDESSALISGQATMVTVKNNEANTDKKNSSKWSGFYGQYLGSDFIDPDGTGYQLNIVDCGSGGVDKNTGETCEDRAQIFSTTEFPNDHKMLVVLEAECNGEETVKTGNPRKLAVAYRLEGAGVYCSNT